MQPRRAGGVRDFTPMRCRTVETSAKGVEASSRLIIGDSFSPLFPWFVGRGVNQKKRKKTRIRGQHDLVWSFWLSLEGEPQTEANAGSNLAVLVSVKQRNRLINPQEHFRLTTANCLDSPKVLFAENGDNVLCVAR